MPPPGPHVFSLTRTHLHATVTLPPEALRSTGKADPCVSPAAQPSPGCPIITKSHVPGPAQHTAPVPLPPCSALGAFAHADPSAWSAVPCSCLWQVCLRLPLRLSVACSQVAALGCPGLCWSPGQTESWSPALGALQPRMGQGPVPEKGQETDSLGLGVGADCVPATTPSFAAQMQLWDIPRSMSVLVVPWNRAEVAATLGSWAFCSPLTLTASGP